MEINKLLFLVLCALLLVAPKASHAAEKTDAVEVVMGYKVVATKPVSHELLLKAARAVAGMKALREFPQKDRNSVVMVAGDLDDGFLYVEVRKEEQDVYRLLDTYRYAAKTGDTERLDYDDKGETVWQREPAK